MAVGKERIGLDDVSTCDLPRLIDAGQQPDHLAVAEIAARVVHRPTLTEDGIE